MQNTHALCCDERGFFSRLCENRIACNKGCCNLAGEDRQREVPRADTDNWTKRLVRNAQRAAGLFGIITQEVDRFAYFCNRVWHGLASFTHDEAEQFCHFTLHDVRSAIKAGCTISRRNLRPACNSLLSRFHCLCNIVGGDFRNRTHDIGMIAGIQNRTAFTLNLGASNLRFCSPGTRSIGLERFAQFCQLLFIGKVETCRVFTNAIKAFRQVDLVVTCTDNGHRTNDFRRIGNQFINRHALVANAIDEGRVRTVFEQTTDQIGQQRFMRTNWRINASWTTQLRCTDYFVIKRLAHAMKALEFIRAGFEIRACQMIDRGKRLRIMCCKLREDHIAGAKQFASASNVGNVGMNLAGVNREIFKAINLRALDFGVPVSALDETNHDATIVASGKIDNEIKHKRAALAIGLHHEADAFPISQIRIFNQALQKVERQLQTVCFFSIDIEANIVLLGKGCERLHLWQKFAHDAFALSANITRMQRRKFDRNARTIINAAAGGSATNRVDRSFVVLVITFCVGSSRGSFTEHVVGITESAFFKRFCALQCFIDSFAGDELLTHHAHGHIHAATDNRLATTGDQASKRCRKTAVIDGVGELAGDNKPPGCSIDEQRTTTANMRLPIAIGNLVADQRITRCHIRNTQQSFGKAHQRHAFLARQ